MCVCAYVCMCVGTWCVYVYVCVYACVRASHQCFCLDEVATEVVVYVCVYACVRASHQCFCLDEVAAEVVVQHLKKQQARVRERRGQERVVGVRLFYYKLPSDI